jgi:hypothetical protein
MPSKQTKMEDVSDGKDLTTVPDQMEEIREFIRKKQLENMVLKKLTDELNGRQIDEVKTKKPSQNTNLCP